MSTPDNCSIDSKLNDPSNTQQTMAHSSASSQLTSNNSSSPDDDNEVDQYDEADDDMSNDLDPIPLPEELTVPVLARDILSGEIRNIIVMTGAGISTAAGVPDYGRVTPESIGGVELITSPPTSESSSTIPLPISIVRTYDVSHPMCKMLMDQLLKACHISNEPVVTMKSDSVLYTSDGICTFILSTSRIFELHRNGSVLEVTNTSVSSTSSNQTVSVICQVPEYVRAFFFDTCFRKHPDVLVKVLMDDVFQQENVKMMAGATNKGWSVTERQLVPGLDTLPEQDMNTLYDRVQRAFGLPNRNAWMSTAFFEKHPAAFYQILRKLGFHKRRPTLTHHFIAFLHHKRLLTRHYTQNVDGLHRKTAFNFQESMQLNKEVHGSMLTNRCPTCNSSMLAQEYVRHIALNSRPTCAICSEEKQSITDESRSCSKNIGEQDIPYVRPDIVFEGEPIADNVMFNASSDFQTCDLLLVIGTSLRQYPFASWIDRAPVDCLRVLINREPVGETRHITTTTEYKHMMAELEITKDPERRAQIRTLIANLAREHRRIGFNFANKERDLLLCGEADEMILQLLDALKWRNEFADFIGMVSSDMYPLLQSYPVQWQGPAPFRNVQKKETPTINSVSNSVNGSSHSALICDSPFSTSTTTLGTTAVLSRKTKQAAAAPTIKRTRPHNARFADQLPEHIPYKRRLTAGSNSIYKTNRPSRNGNIDEDDEGEITDW